MKKGLTGTSSNFIDALKPVDDARLPQPMTLYGDNLIICYQNNILFKYI